MPKIMSLKDDLDFYDTFKTIFMKPDLIAQFDQLYIHNEAFPAACRLVRKLAPNYIKLNEHLDGAMQQLKIVRTPSQILLNKPLMYLDESNKKDLAIIIFPNVILSSNDQEILKRISPFLFGDTLKHTAEMLVANKAHLNTYAKAWSKIKKTERLSIERALSRYTTLGEMTKASEHVRDIAAYINELFAPVELQYATTPAELVTMYASGGPHSCMSLAKDVNHSSYSNEAVCGGNVPPLSFMAKQFNTHPTEFYLHMGAKGVYMKRGKTVLARAFLYPYPDGKFRYGRVYASTPTYREQFIKTLDEEYTAVNKSADKGGHIGVPFEFTVPYRGDYKSNRAKAFVPFPYIDQFASGYLLDEPEQHQIRFWFNCTKDKVHNKATILNLTNQRGYIFANECAHITCANCRGVINPANRYFSTTTGLTFCSASCFTDSGFIMARRDDGTTVLVSKAEPDLIRDANNHNMWYTNVNSAIKNGCVPYLIGQDIVRYATENYPKHYHGLKLGNFDTKYMYKNTEKYFYPNLSGSSAIPYVKAFRVAAQKITSILYTFDIDKFNEIKTEETKPKEKISDHPLIKVTYEE